MAATALIPVRDTRDSVVKLHPLCVAYVPLVATCVSNPDTISVAVAAIQPVCLPVVSLTPLLEIDLLVCADVAKNPLTVEVSAALVLRLNELFAVLGRRATNVSLVALYGVANTRRSLTYQYRAELYLSEGAFSVIAVALM